MALTGKQKAARATAAAAARSNKQQVDAPPASSENITAPPVHAPKPAGEKGRTVVVVSKMPRGLYLQLTQMISQDQRVMGGGIEKRQVAMRVGDKLRIKPSVLAFGLIPNYPIIEGFSLTRDVPSAFWRAYQEQNPQIELITSGLLRAFDNEPDAIAYCREYGKLKTGLEPIDQNGDPRVEQSMNPNVSDVEIDTDSKATRAA